MPAPTHGETRPGRRGRPCRSHAPATQRGSARERARSPADRPRLDARDVLAVLDHVELVGDDRVLLGAAVDDVTLAVLDEDRVAAASAVDPVPTGAADYGVRARACLDPVVASPAQDAV